MQFYETDLLRLAAARYRRALAAEKKPVTIQNMPAPAHMPAITWAPDGKRFAWMEDKAI